MGPGPADGGPGAGPPAPEAGDGGTDPDAVLAAAGAALAAAVAGALPAFVRRGVEGAVPPGWPGRAEVLAAADDAGRRAAAEAGEALAALLGADVDRQPRTPLEVVRGALAGPTAVLRAAGVPAPGRDAFTRARLPHDVYGLAPASLGAVAPEVGELALAWGAAKALAHRRRHGGPR